MKWYFPAWNGDIRIAEHPDDNKKTIITMHEPTAAEMRVLKSLATIFHAKGWSKRKTIWNPRGDKKKQETVVDAPLVEIGRLMMAGLKPGLATLTAIKFEDGKGEAMGNVERGVLSWLGKIFGNEGEEKSDGDPAAISHVADILEKQASGEKPKEDSPHRKEAEDTAVAKKEEDKPKKKAKAAATVKRPTPSCPKCYVDACEPATEVLLSFLDEEQHRQWEHNRSFIVRGGLTGHPYLIAHRHSRNAEKMGKICMDLHDGGVLHFHDWTVPPEEEVLAAKLILEQREPWLRNEATCLTSVDIDTVGVMSGFDMVFKNPFGGCGDGVADSAFTGEIGTFIRGFLAGFDPEKYGDVVSNMLNPEHLKQTAFTPYIPAF